MIKRMILVTAVIALFFLPVTGLAKMSLLTDTEMEAVSGRDGVSFGLVGVDGNDIMVDVDYIAYGDSDGYSGDASPAAGYLNIDSLDMALDTSQSEITIDVATDATRNFLQIGLSPLEVTIAPQAAVPGPIEYQLYTTLGITSPSSTHQVHENQYDPSSGTLLSDDAGGFFPTGDGSYNEANTTEYANIAIDDTNYFQSGDYGFGDYPWFRIRFVLDEPQADISQIDLKIILGWTSGSDTLELCVYNRNTDHWDQLDTAANDPTQPAGRKTLTDSLTTNFDYYVDENGYFYMAGAYGNASEALRLYYAEAYVTSQYITPAIGGGIFYINTNTAPGSGGNNLGSIEISATFTFDGDLNVWGH